MNAVSCPVPIRQRPVKEYQELQESFFYSLPLNKSLNKVLTISWVVIFPFNFTILTNIKSINHNIYLLLFISSIASFVCPILLLTRLWMGWGYIYKRLLSHTVEYEENGWQDGNTWEKPISWREKDLLIAQNEVKPLIRNLINLLRLSILLLLGEVLLFELLKIIKIF